MAKKLGIIAAVCCALALSFALVGCASVDKSNYIGNWTLASSTSEDLDADSIALMKSLGLETNLTLNEDGSGKLDMFGDESDIKWEATSNTEGKVTRNSAETSMKLANGQLTLADVNGSALTFTRK